VSQNRSSARQRTRPGTLKIATYNINNVRSRLSWIGLPRLMCLQELKTAHGDFPLGPIQGAGYHAVWKGEKTWNGVAILSSVAEPIVTRDSLPGDPADKQSRYIEAAIGSPARNSNTSGRGWSAFEITRPS
jgi:exodeoxyribonuclease-3